MIPALTIAAKSVVQSSRASSAPVDVQHPPVITPGVVGRVPMRTNYEHLHYQGRSPWHPVHKARRARGFCSQSAAHLRWRRRFDLDHPHTFGVRAGDTTVESAISCGPDNRINSLVWMDRDTAQELIDALRVALLAPDPDDPLAAG
jgi:hypothetical protein